MSPSVSPLKVENIDSVQLLVILFVCSLKRKNICGYTSAIYFIIIAVFISVSKQLIHIIVLNG